MTIRRKLLFAFICVGLLSTALQATLSFIKVREVLRQEIEASVRTQAVNVAQDIDRMMFERLQNALTWSRLDVMQDIQVKDIDKRVSHFLSDLENGYGDIYVDLSCTDLGGQIVSSSNAALIGHSPAASQPWLQAGVAGGTIALDEPVMNDTPAVDMRVPVSATYTSGGLGELHLRLDWRRFFDVLDHAAGHSGRMLAVLDHQGRVIAASEGLRQHHVLMGDALSGLAHLRLPVVVTQIAALPESDVIVGRAASPGYGSFAGWGWTTLVIQPTDIAFAPIRHIAWGFAGLMLLITVLTALAATLVSQSIATPILALTQFVRHYVHARVRQRPRIASSGEVGELTQAFAQMIDDIEQSQQNLIRASKFAVVGELSSAIAHEVRTPLGILRSSAQMLEREAHLSAEGRELLGFIASETERLNNLVSGMLDVARPRTASFAQVDIHDVIRKCSALVQPTAEANRITVHQHLDAVPSVLACDEEQITQVLLNVLMNGLQILHEGGQIEVHTRTTGQTLHISIADDGPGIAPEERARIFEAFFFRREGGVGLGLAIVQQIVLAHHGTIDATHSDLGGALFHIQLPLSQSQAP